MDNGIKIRFAKKSDKVFWFSLDKHLPEREFGNKVRDRQAYVITVDGFPAGILRYNLFWDNTPFCTLLYIADGYQRRGLGKALMYRWEADMRALGYDRVLTSTQSDESAQHFYRAIGYSDCGSLTEHTGLQPR